MACETTCGLLHAYSSSVRARLSRSATFQGRDLADKSEIEAAKEHVKGFNMDGQLERAPTRHIRLIHLLGGPVPLLHQSVVEVNPKDNNSTLARRWTRRTLLFGVDFCVSLQMTAALHKVKGRAGKTKSKAEGLGWTGRERQGMGTPEKKLTRGSHSGKEDMMNPSIGRSTQNSKICAGTRRAKGKVKTPALDILLHNKIISGVGRKGCSSRLDAR